MSVELLQGDCLIEMSKIADKSIDMVLCDPPFGTTACDWDTIIPFDNMWEQLKRIVKPKGAIVFFSSQPFTSALVMSNPKWFRYEWIWCKDQGRNFQLVKYQPLKITENILVFSEQPTPYYPQGMVKLRRAITKNNAGKGGKLGHLDSENKRSVYTQEYANYPINIIECPSERGEHPTQKPVPLLSYLIRTYTQQSDKVLDFTMGSGSTIVACIEEKRNAIGIELDEHYFRVASERINKELTKPRTMQMELV